MMTNHEVSPGVPLSDTNLMSAGGMGTGESASHGDMELAHKILSLQRQIDSLKGHYDIASSITDALEPKTIAYYMTGPLAGLNRDYTHTAFKGRSMLVGHFCAAWQEGIVDGKYRKIRQSQVENSASQLGHMAGLGLAGTEATSAMPLTLHLLYSRESPPVWEDDILDRLATSMQNYPKDMHTLFGTTKPGKITFNDIITALHKREKPDTSQETLDLRFNTFCGALNLDLSLAILQCLGFYSGFGNHNNALRAVELARGHRKVLLSDDLGTKQAMLELVSGLCQEAAVSEKERGHAFLAIGGYADALRINTDEFLGFFSNVYTSLGYELPSSLRHDVLSETPAAPEEAPVAIAVARPAAKLPKPEPGYRPELAAEISGLVAELNGRAEEAMQPWGFSNSQIKSLGAGALMRALKGNVPLKPDVPGFGAQLVPDEEGFNDDTWNSPPLTHTYAASIVGTIVRLGHADMDRNQAAAQLEAAEVSRQDLADSVMLLQAYAESQGYTERVSVPQLPDMNARLQLVSDNWHIFRRLFSELAPEHCRANFVGLAWQVLPEPRSDSPYVRLLTSYHDVSHKS